MKRIIISIVVALAPMMLYAQEAMSFIAVSHDMGAMSMAQTITSPVSVVSDASSFVSAGVMKLMPKALSSTDAFTKASWSNGSFGFGIEYVGGFGESYLIYGDDGFATRSFKPSTMNVGISAAYKLESKYSVGLDLHYASEGYAPQTSASAAFANLAAEASFDAFTVGGGLTAIGTSVKDNSGQSHSLPASAFVNGSWRSSVSDAVMVSAGAEAQMYFAGAMALGAGVGVTVLDILSLRAGYHFAASDAPLPSFLSVGAGVSFSGLQIETCYLSCSETLSGSVGLRLGYRF